MTLSYSIQKTYGHRYAAANNVRGTADDLARLCEMVQADEFVPGMPWLVDNRELREMPCLEEVERLAELLGAEESAIQGARIAVVAIIPTAFGMARMFEHYAHSMPFDARAFWLMDDAMGWLFSEPGSGRLRMIQGAGREARDGVPDESRSLAPSAPLICAEGVGGSDGGGSFRC